MAEYLDIDKFVWDQSDFERMEWHDCSIHAFAFKDEDFEFALDIDYILKWIGPEGSETHFKFLIAPATLIFGNVWDINIDLEVVSALELQDLHRENPRTPKNAKYAQGSTEFDWRVVTNGGDITFKSNGFKLHLRNRPIETSSQKMKITERGGISFETQGKASG